MRQSTRRRLVALLDDARLQDCDVALRVRDALTQLASDHPRRGTLALSELAAAYKRLRLRPGSTEEDLLGPAVAELISLARAVQHCEDAETRLERTLALYEAARGER